MLVRRFIGSLVESFIFKDEPFDPSIHSDMCNCNLCWKKSEDKRYRAIIEDPSRALQVCRAVGNPRDVRLRALCNRKHRLLLRRLEKFSSFFGCTPEKGGSGSPLLSYRQSACDLI